MEKLKKFLLKLNKEERDKIEIILEHITSDNLEDTDIKKLRGYADVFRVRIGKHRVIFQREEKVNMIIEISRRSEKTYKKLK